VIAVHFSLPTSLSPTHHNIDSAPERKEFVGKETRPEETSLTSERDARNVMLANLNRQRKRRLERADVFSKLARLDDAMLDRMMTQVSRLAFSVLISGSSARLGFLCLAARGWLGQGQDNERFASHGADVVVQAHHLDAGDVLNQRLQKWLRRFDQMCPYLLE